jgi:hypothetical protein
MARAHEHLGWRSLTILVLCGAVAGFAVPTIASSLVQQVRHEPGVRLLPAPHTPTSATVQAAPPTPASQANAPVTRLTTKQLERKYPLPRRPTLSGTLVQPHAHPLPVPELPAATAPKAPSAPKPPTEHAPTKPTTKGTGGAVAPPAK